MIKKIFFWLWERSGNRAFIGSFKVWFRNRVSIRMCGKKRVPVSLKECCQTQGGKLHILAPAGTATVYSKHYWGSSDEVKCYSFPCLPVYTAELINATVVGGRSYILCGNQCIEDFFEYDAEERYCMSEYGLHRNDDRTVSVLPGDADLTTWEHVIPTGISLLNIANYNYFHFLVDTCARLAAVDQIEEYQKLPLLVEQSVIENPRLSECLDAVNQYGHPIISIPARTAYLVQHLVAVSTPCWMPFNLNPGVESEPRDFLYSWHILQLMRDTVIGRLENPSSRIPKKIFLSRKFQSRSRLSNADETEELFTSYGYTVIYPENMLFSDQVQFFRNADYIAAAGGAALSNLLFCREGTHVAIIAPESHSSISWSTYATLNKLDVAFLSATDIVSGKYDAQKTFALDLDCAESYLIGNRMRKKSRSTLPYESKPVSKESPSRILFCAYSNMAFSPSEELWDSHAEGFLNALERNGSDVLCIRTNNFVISSTSNSLRPTIDREKLKKKISEFAPQLIISYNNTLPGEDIFSYTDCPVVVYPADVPSFWASPEMIEKNLDRYLFFDTARQIRETVNKLYPSVRQIQFVPFGYATDFHALPVEQDINISFVGSIGNLSENFANYFAELESSGLEADELNQIKDEFYDALDRFRVDSNTDFQFSFPYSKWAYDQRMVAPLSILLLTCTTRFKTLSNITDLGLRVYGWSGSWAKTLTYDLELFRCFDYTRSITLKENMYTYNRSKISLNLPHGNNVDGFSWRVCDVLASNAVLLSVKKPDLSTLMEPYYPKFPMFESVAESRYLAKKLLDDPAWRKDITLASHEMIDNCCRFERKFEAMEQAVPRLHLNNNDRTGAKEFMRVLDYSITH